MGTGPRRPSTTEWLSDCSAASGMGPATRVTGPSLNLEPSSWSVLFQNETASSTSLSRPSPAELITVIFGT